jgi:cytochrome b subunit of formate dehydrogenase
MALAGASASLLVTPGAAFAAETELVRGAGSDHDCLVCHAGIGPEDAPKLLLDLYRPSAHGEIGCVSCHTDVEDGATAHEAEDEDLAPVRCEPCHEAEGRIHTRSVHAEVKRGATCAQCHGGHDVFAARDRRSSTNPLNLSATCGECHGADRRASGHTLEVPRALRGRQLPIDGDPPARMIAEGISLTLCTDCHGGHDLQRAARPGSATHASQLSGTCGACHENARAEMERSVHAQAGADGKPRATCISCHPIHGGLAAGPAELGGAAVRECGRCHEALMQTYAGSYHGKATLTGDATAARCSDCHGSHAVLGAADPASQIAPRNKLATCRSCHPDASSRFASFMPHADPGDRARAPLLYWTRAGLMGLTALLAAFFTLHTLAWALRARRDPAPAAGTAAGAAPDRTTVLRFGPLPRILHATAIVSFLGLGATGVPMSASEQGWAQAAIGALGGVHGAGLLHRIFAVTALAAFALHLALAVRSAWLGRRRGERLFGPDSIVPRAGDLRELASHARWFAGRGPRPAWNRWAYWEKLQYWTVVVILVLSGATGLALWYPTEVSRHLPGSLLNLAAVLHSREALLAATIAIAAHVAHALLRRGSGGAALDQSMLTGLVLEEDYRRDRALEWARIEAQGRAAALRAPPAAAWRRRTLTALGIAASLGCAALLGLALIGLLSP